MWLPLLGPVEPGHLFDCDPASPSEEATVRWGPSKCYQLGCSQVEDGLARWGHNSKALSNCWVFHDNDCYEHLGTWANCHPPGQYAPIVSQCRGASCSPKLGNVPTCTPKKCTRCLLTWAVCLSAPVRDASCLPTWVPRPCEKVPTAAHLGSVSVCTCEEVTLGGTSRGVPAWC